MSQLAIDVDFRMAMRRFAASVSILTLSEGDRPFGMVATAVCSLSFEPPSVLACINRSAYLHPMFLQAKHFGINVLAVDQEDVVHSFFGQEDRTTRFRTLDWHLGKEGVPIIKGCQSSMVCSINDRIEHTSHTIIIGQVANVAVRNEVQPLIYVDGQLSQHAPRAGK